jgi:site-specific DNA-methyltransferase (adenine-specific)
VFLNPPYSKPGPWLQKAIRETNAGSAELVIALLPVRTDTRWFHDYVLPIADLRFIKGRIKWIGWQGTPIPSPKEPNMLAIYRGTHA